MEKLIQKWKKENLISEDQAMHMLQDLSDQKSERKSSLFVGAISTIGAILLGIGIISFVAANWSELGNVFRVFLIFSITFLVFGLGFYWTIYKESFVKTGNALLFLGTLCFGGSIFLIAQIYNVQAGTPHLILLWILGIIPIVYLLASRIHMALLSLLIFIYYIYIAIDSFDNGFSFIFIGTLISIALVVGGSVHYYSKDLSGLGRVMRLFGLGVGIILLYILTFLGDFHDSQNMNLVIYILTFFIAAVGLTLLVKPPKFGTQTLYIETGTGIVLTIVLLFFIAIGVSAILMEIIFAALCVLILYFGYRREDMKLINIGIFATFAYILGKYIEFFVEILPGVVFFTIAGVIFITGGIILEKQRRKLKLFFIESQHVEE